MQDLCLLCRSAAVSNLADPLRILGFQSSSILADNNAHGASLPAPAIPSHKTIPGQPLRPDSHMATFPSKVDFMELLDINVSIPTIIRGAGYGSVC